MASGRVPTTPDLVPIPLLPGTDDLAAYDIVAAVSNKVEELAATLSESREVMNPEEAADFLRISYDAFRKIAPSIPRRRVSGRRYVYMRGELLN